MTLSVRLSVGRSVGRYVGLSVSLSLFPRRVESLTSMPLSERVFKLQSASLFYDLLLYYYYKAFMFISPLKNRRTSTSELSTYQAGEFICI